MPVTSFTIGRLARVAGVKRSAVRYYERRGLLPEPARTASGYRLFPAAAAQRLRFIQRAQKLGFTLREIQELLDLRANSRGCTQEVRRHADAKIKDIESRIRTLEAMRKSLRRLAQACPGCGPLSDCPILESLDASR